MPECQVAGVFQHFRPKPSLDKDISGIPNAITSASRQGRAAAGDRKMDVKEEANV
jgi:hypothetical protein